MTNKELVARAKDIATNYKTLYVYCGFGAPSTTKNVTRYCNNCDYNKKPARTKMIKATEGKGYFFFDCVNLIKGILWGWNGDATKTYGGAKYCSNGVPDVSADGMIKKCKNVSKDFSNIEVGEVVHMSGHIGIYIGDGLAVECTPKWDNCVQITAVGNIGKVSGYNTRTWVNHGKLPYVEYVSDKPTNPYTEPTRTIKKGCKGEDVKWVQWWLTKKGYDIGSSGIDGSCGSATDKAIRAFQKDKKLEVDGKCGAKTRAALKS